MTAHVSNRAADCHRKQVPKGHLYMRPIQWHLKLETGMCLSPQRIIFLHSDLATLELVTRENKRAS